MKYREKVISLDFEKRQLQQRLEEMNNALNLADCHLQQEISKVKLSLEHEYNRRVENEQKRFQFELNQLRQQLNNEIDNKRLANNSLEDIEEIKKVYRIEIERLYRKFHERSNIFYFSYD